MRVNAIQTYKPIFSPVKNMPQIYFAGKPDSFSKSEFNFDTEAQNYYNKLERTMNLVTPKDVRVSANRVSKKTGIALDEVYETMGMLSQYSSYKSLEGIKDILNNEKLFLFTGLPSKLLDDNLPLTNVLSYILDRNDVYNLSFQDRGLLVDSNLLKTVENMDKKKKAEFQMFLEDSNIKPIYLENFENGYNFLNQGKNFEDFTTDILEKAKDLQHSNGKSIGYNLHYILNHDVYENLNVLSKDLTVIRQQNISTPEKIADNLNQIMPSQEDFKNIINTISRGKVDAQKEILDFLNNNMQVITPQKYCRYLKNMHKRLENFLINRGKTFDDVYFIIPSVKKSFMPANYVYSKINNIENPKYIFLDSDHNNRVKQIQNLPENAVAVVIDDCVLSGSSMLREHFLYDRSAKLLSADKDVVFAPIVASYAGINRIAEDIKYNNRHDILICGQMLPEVNSMYNNLLIQNNNGLTTTSVVFPYMGPDMNCNDLVPLYEKFFYSKNAQKEILIGV